MGTACGCTTGPLAEIGYWRSRSIDLRSLSAQLSGAGIAAVTGVLTKAGSTYLPPFLSLSNSIVAAATLAASNLQALSCLEPLCTQLDSWDTKVSPNHARHAHPIVTFYYSTTLYSLRSTGSCGQLLQGTQHEPLLQTLCGVAVLTRGIVLLQDISAVLRDILRRLCVLWSSSEYYGQAEPMTGLLHRVSQAVIQRCSAAISVSDILAGDVEHPITGLQQVTVRADCS